MKPVLSVSRVSVARRLCLWAAAIALLAACATAPPQGRADLLDFLQVGSTRRAEVRMHLGEPSATFEGDRILAYRLRRDEGGYILVKGGSDWSQVRYNLMLAFDTQGVLQRHALVDVNPP